MTFSRGSITISKLFVSYHFLKKQGASKEKTFLFILSTYAMDVFNNLRELMVLDS